MENGGTGEFTDTENAATILYAAMEGWWMLTSTLGEMVDILLAVGAVDATHQHGCADIADSSAESSN